VLLPCLLHHAVKNKTRHMYPLSHAASVPSTWERCRTKPDLRKHGWLTFNTSYSKKTPLSYKITISTVADHVWQLHLIDISNLFLHYILYDANINSFNWF
jgi:hypothetical protein